jgi:hypothetical protein
VLVEPRARPADPATPSAAQRTRFAGIDQDPIEDKPICSTSVREAWGPLQSRGGRSEHNCRDPFPYLESNEPRGWLWAPYVANLGGAYVGVGADQNLAYAAAAASEWVWLMDYDPRVVDHNRRMIALVLASATPEEFVSRWSPRSQRVSIELIEAAFAGTPELSRMRLGFIATRERLYEYYREQAAPSTKAPDFGWLRNPEHYRWVRTLAEQGRLVAIKGDLLGGKSMQSIGAAARELGTVVRIYYVSNAPTSWGGQITETYRDNVLALPFDERSIVLQTTSKGGFRQMGKWHHNVQWGRHLQMRLRQKGYDDVLAILEDRIPADHGDLTVLGLPGAAQPAGSKPTSQP